MPLINAFKNPDAPSPHTTHTTTDITITIGGQPLPVTQSRRDEMAARVASAVEAHRIAMRAETAPGWPRAWVTSEGRAADFPRVELVPHHHLDRTEHEERTERTDQRRYRLTVLQSRLEALQRPLSAIANESASIARDGVGSWSSEQVDVLVRIADLEMEVETLLEALRELF